MNASTTPPSKPSNWNIANALTALRIALVPLFVFLMLHDDGHVTSWRIAATVAFLAAIITDRIDGDLARSRGLVTDLGKIADPIADKALIGAALISLSIVGALWWWVTVVVLVRELGITVMRFFMIRYGVMAASRGGKAKTVVQSMAISLMVAPLPGVVEPLAFVCMGVAVALTLVTGLDYVFQAVRLRRTVRRERHSGAPAS
ncbi:CDP-diacylglycerol--glycerol-3-phosphate 3-phosphatidyltransferase [Kineosporia sp. J2-2]|uniref:CDP-diacylglycerol--glycerol-3-phosphate 3-phosphatidyltransferase n=1 Tax=Kineosporia corallincola TaxID=2835133 RepID=A0ABS5TT11_9ACTN|nr:CDP-diacylglycerol--glycerol-3-phosphate 3-phosphatidyltransferase [Kineosporia corallincola]MBT0773889.1 CDP-diacylglycerol--glycerol-3-phosphate 3-phosphatidyltransferase [Kineosporia corallincola]